MTQRNSEAARAAARSLGLTFQMVEAPELPEVTNIFARINTARGSSLIVEGSLFFMDHADDITKLAAKYKLPAI